MTTVKELRKDVDQIKSRCHIGNTEQLEHYAALNEALIRYSRLSEITPEEDKRAAVKQIVKEYGNRTGRWNDLSLEE